MEVVLVQTEGPQDDDTESLTETDGCGHLEGGEDEVDGLDSEALTKRTKSVMMRDLMEGKSLGTSMKIGEYFKSSIDEYM